MQELVPLRPVGIGAGAVIGGVAGAGVGYIIGDGLSKIPAILNRPKGPPVPDAVPHPQQPVTGTGTRQWEKPGNFNNAVDDFNSLNPSGVRPIRNGGMVGTLPDGRPINVRPTSDSKQPTIDIQRPDGKRSDDKIRYR